MLHKCLNPKCEDGCRHCNYLGVLEPVPRHTNVCLYCHGSGQCPCGCKDKCAICNGKGAREYGYIALLVIQPMAEIKCLPEHIRRDSLGTICINCQEYLFERNNDD